MKQKNAGVAILGCHTEAEAAVKELRAASFETKRISIVAKDYHHNEQSTPFWELWGALFGSAFFLMIPRIGHVVVGGQLVSSLIGALKDVSLFGGLTALGAGLCRLGIPQSRVNDYETAIRSHKFLLVAHGTTEDVRKARDILDHHGLALNCSKIVDAPRAA